MLCKRCMAVLCCSKELCANCLNPKTKRVVIDYTNWKGNRRFRQIEPLRIFVGANQFHKTEGWLLEAIDLEDDSKVKCFPLGRIHAFREEEV